MADRRIYYLQPAEEQARLRRAAERLQVAQRLSGLDRASRLARAMRLR